MDGVGVRVILLIVGAQTDQDSHFLQCVTAALPSRWSALEVSNYCCRLRLKVQIECSERCQGQPYSIHTNLARLQNDEPFNPDSLRHPDLTKPTLMPQACAPVQSHKGKVMVVSESSTYPCLVWTTNTARSIRTRL